MESKLERFSAAAFRSTDTMNVNYFNGGAANESVHDESSTLAIEEIRSNDDAPIPFCQTERKTKHDSYQEMDMYLKGGLEVVEDYLEPLPENVNSAICGNSAALMKIKHDDMSRNEFKKSANAGNEIESFQYERHLDEPNVSCESSKQHMLSNHGSEESSVFVDDHENGMINAQTQRITECERNSSKEFLVSEATLVPDTFQAMLVTDEDMIHDSNTSQSNFVPKNNSFMQSRIMLRRALVLGGIFILVLVTTLLVVLRDNGDDSVFIPTHESILKLIIDQSNVNESLFNNVLSYQRQALDWLVNDMITNNVTNNSTYNSPQILERFALAVLYYATNGRMWDNEVNFLSSGHVCNWTENNSSSWFNPKGVIGCTSDSRVARLALHANNLQGSLPLEIGLLNKLEYIYLTENGITGILPPLQSLTELRELYLHGNHLVGTLPYSILRIENLEVLDIGDNHFHGKLPEVTNVTKLTFMQFGENRFTGEVPTSYGSLPYIGIFDIRNTNLTGNVDFLCPHIDDSVNEFFGFECFDDDPKIICHCCNWCDFVSENDCDEKNKTKLTLNISEGEDFVDQFNWEIRKSSKESDTLLFAHGTYQLGDSTHHQMCLTFPGDYYIRATNNGTETNDFNVTVGTIFDAVSFISFDAVPSPESDADWSSIAFSLDSDGLLSNLTTNSLV